MVASSRATYAFALAWPGGEALVAEAVGVATSLGLTASYFPSDRDVVSLVPGYLLGVVLKDDEKDRERLLAYWDSTIKRRAEAAARS